MAERDRPRPVAVNYTSCLEHDETVENPTTEHLEREGKRGRLDDRLN